MRQPKEVTGSMFAAGLHASIQLVSTIMRCSLWYLSFSHRVHVASHTVATAAYIYCMHL
jgi:hypothetical protein